MSVKLYSVAKGDYDEFKAEVLPDGEIYLTNGAEGLKFPAGLTKTEFNKLVNEHNKDNEGRTFRSPEEVAEERKAAERSQKLVDSL